jgi:8-oxo-dGTP pyrophosphatase MutT (NUDIX family)
MDTRRKKIRSLLGKTVHVDVDRPIGYRHGDIVYPVNYGYVPGLIAGDGEEQDAYILGVTVPVSAFDGQVIAIVCRENDTEDKLIVAPEGTVLHQGQIAEAVGFQEQYFSSYILSLHRKSCGVIPYRIFNGQREYLIVYEQYSRCWSFPKGHMEAGETELQAAQRELQEETGLTVRLSTEQQISIEYPVSAVSQKQVVFFIGEIVGIPRIREGEIGSFRWVSKEEFGNYLHADTVEACRAHWDLL